MKRLLNGWLEKEHRFPRSQRQLESFVKSRLVAIRTNCAETTFWNFRSIRPEFVIRKSARLRVNFAVLEYSIAVLAVQSPLWH
jgi:hypothetical protein